MYLPICIDGDLIRSPHVMFVILLLVRDFGLPGGEGEGGGGVATGEMKCEEGLKQIG